MLNYSVLLGRIGQELTLKQTPNGAEVVSFNLAVERNYNKDITDWISVVAWKGTAKIISQYFKKGDMICIEGSIQTRNYDDKDGKKVYVTEIVADKVHFVNSKSESNTTSNTFDTTPNTTPVANTNDNLNPFNADGFTPVDSGDKLPWDN